jgi:hypothetical protein
MPHDYWPPSRPLPGRNEILGFAERTRRNLDFIRSAYEQGNRDVHLVTQAVVSLLGIVVFPYEQYFKMVSLNHKLSDLEAAGWPHWSQTGWQATDLRHLLRRIRNATAHSGITFSSDSAQAVEVRIAFDCYFEEENRDWQGEIAADKLLEFCERFLRYVDDYVG